MNRFLRVGRNLLAWARPSLLEDAGGVLFWHKCLNKFVKYESTQEMSVIEYIKWKDSFMCLKTGPWGPTMDLSIGK